jgi:AbrB family looped-hinge helix DNA binding protein
MEKKVKHEMGECVKVLQKGEITIPTEIRQKLGIGEGDYIELQIVGNKLVLLPPNTVTNPTELISGLAEGITIKDSVKQKLRKATAARIKKKIQRTI